MKKTQTNKPARSKNNKFSKVVAVAATFTLLLAVLAVPAFAAEINTGLTTETLVGGIIEFVCQVAMYIGFVIAAAGIFMFIMAYKDDNTESQSRGARFAVVGALLIGLKPLLKLTGLTK